MENNKDLYNSIMSSVSKQVKRILNEDIQKFDTAEYREDEYDITYNHEVKNIIGPIKENMHSYTLYNEGGFSDDEILELFDKFDESKYTLKIRQLSDVLKNFYIAAGYESFFISIWTDEEYKSLSLNRDLEGKEHNIEGTVNLIKNEQDPYLYINLYIPGYYDRIDERFIDIITDQASSFVYIKPSDSYELWSCDEGYDLCLNLNASVQVLQKDISNITKLLDTFIKAQKKIDSLKEQIKDIETEITETESRLEMDMLDIAFGKKGNSK